MNFVYNMQPYYDIENLNTYPSVNPSTESGQQMMDAGEGLSAKPQNRLTIDNLNLTIALLNLK